MVIRRDLLAAAAKRRGVSQVALVREAIEASLRMPGAACGPWLFEQISDLIGVANDGPSDLATNPAHMEGFGLDGPRCGSSA